MQAFGRAANGDVRVYFVGGTTAVMIGWRTTTIDVDFVMRPKNDAILRAIPALKETLGIDVEMASPADSFPSRTGGRTAALSSRKYSVWRSTTSTCTPRHSPKWSAVIARTCPTCSK